MLFLANAGTEILRLDAVAFIWKQLGTSCENLPEAHILIQAFNAVARIASPSLMFKSEAIVHPDDVTRYISPEECQLSYNPLLMALLWNSLATREVRLLKQALAEQNRIHQHCAWVNYVRCHDDIGWTFSDEAAARFGILGSDHRRFLNSFFTGRFEGSFARGLPFQENPKTGDARISGTCASLAGLEKAIKEETQLEVDLAIQRILLIHAVILTVGGVPLLYLGDEVGTLNDYSFRTDSSKSQDSRWVHRPYTDWKKLGKRLDPETIEGRIFQGLQRLVHLRENYAIFGAGRIDVIEPDNDQILAFARVLENERVLVFANFSESAQTISANLLRLYALSYSFQDVLTGEQLPFKDIILEPYGVKFILVGP
jgi:amylosucrase